MSEPLTYGWVWCPLDRQTASNVAARRQAMSESDKVFAGSIPESYDRYLVPLIFENFAEDIAQRAAALSPRSVLETAAGPGVVTRALSPRLLPGGRYLG